MSLPGQLYVNWFQMSVAKQLPIGAGARVLHVCLYRYILCTMFAVCSLKCHFVKVG